VSRLLPEFSFGIVASFSAQYACTNSCKGGVDVRINSVKNMRHTDAAETEALSVDEGDANSHLLMELYAFHNVHKRKNECNQKQT